MNIILDTSNSFDQNEVDKKISAFTRDMLLTFQNVSVTTTHHGHLDVPLIKANHTNTTSTDCLVSIQTHIIEDSGQWNGFETIFHPTASQKALSLANRIQKNLIVSTAFKNLGVQKANFKFPQELSASWLTIVCKITINSSELLLLYSNIFQKTCAEAITKGIADEYNLQKKTTTPMLTGIYKVQIGTFKEKQNAKLLAERLKKDGYDPYITYEK